MTFFGRTVLNRVTAVASDNQIQNSSSVATEKDVEMVDPPTDSISSIAFSSQADFLAVGSWDNSVRVYEIGVGGQSQGKAMNHHQGPVLSVCWNKDSKVFSGGADNSGRMLDLATGQSTQVAQHDGPIKAVRWVETPSAGILATGSWDKTIKYWDLRTNAPVATVTLPERCYTLDVQYPLMVVGTADRHIQIFNLANPQTPYRNMVSPLAWQTRVVSCFTATDVTGFAIGTVEGKVAIQYVEERDFGGNFSFKCHRRDSARDAKDHALIYPVNDISFHPVHGTFSTCGADGIIYFWDKDVRQRLKTLAPAPGPISSTAFNHNGSIFAYAVSYDWYKGHSGMVPGHPNAVMLHACKEDEVTSKQTRK